MQYPPKVPYEEDEGQRLGKQHLPCRWLHKVSLYVSLLGSDDRRFSQCCWLSVLGMQLRGVAPTTEKEVIDIKEGG